MVLKTLICTFDAKTGVLCNMCEDKLLSGQISQSDVDSSIVLTKLAQKNPTINKMTLVSSKEIDDEIILIFKSSDVRLIRSDEKLAKTIQQEFNKNTWFVESDSNDRRFLENLFYPIKINKVNFVWLPDGNKLTQIIVDEKVKESTQNKMDKIKKISMAVRNIDLVIDLE